MRLDRLIGKAAGLGGRALKEKLNSGAVAVNGTVEIDAARLIGRFDRVVCDGAPVQNCTPRRLMLHKPSGHVSATTDAKHPTVIDLIREPWRDELHLAGRLDRFSTGLVILTNDSAFSESLTEPARRMPKSYHVETEQDITHQAVDAIRAGMRFDKEDIITHPAQIELDGERACDLTIYEGKHHQIKRMFARFDIKVTQLHRYRVGNILLDKELAPGDYRPLTESECAAR